MPIVELKKDHCGLEAGRITTMTDSAVAQLEPKGIVKVLQENPSPEAILMAERSQHAKPEPDPQKQVLPIVCPHCQKQYTPPEQDFSAMTPKAIDKPPRDKAMKPDKIKRKGPDNVTTSANLDEDNKPDGESDD